MKFINSINDTSYANNHVMNRHLATKSSLKRMHGTTIN